jgi:hypothetical protein
MFIAPVHRRFSGGKKEARLWKVRQWGEMLRWENPGNCSLAICAYIYGQMGQEASMVVPKVSEHETMTIQERLKIASHGQVQVYDGSTVFDLTHPGFKMDEI